MPTVIAISPNTGIRIRRLTGTKMQRVQRLLKEDPGETDQAHSFPLWQRILLFPLIVVFTCEWHSIHTSILFLASVLMISGFCIGSKAVTGWEIAIAAPSAICLLVLYPIGVITLAVGGRVYSALFRTKD